MPPFFILSAEAPANNSSVQQQSIKRDSNKSNTFCITFKVNKKMGISIDLAKYLVDGREKSGVVVTKVVTGEKGRSFVVVPFVPPVHLFLSLLLAAQFRSPNTLLLQLLQLTNIFKKLVIK